MNGKTGVRVRASGLDGLGHLIPPGTLRPPRIQRGLVHAMEQRRFLAGHGVPSIPTRYVVSMNPADRAALDPTTEDRLAGALTHFAEAAGYLMIGEIEVEFEANADAVPGRPLYWAGFTDDDLLVLSSPEAAGTVFAGLQIGSKSR